MDKDIHGMRTQATKSRVYNPTDSTDHGTAMSLREKVERKGKGYTFRSAHSSHSMRFGEQGYVR